MDEARPDDWLTSPNNVILFAQTLYQVDGYAMTLLVAETETDDENVRPDHASWGR